MSDRWLKAARERDLFTLTLYRLIPSTRSPVEDQLAKAALLWGESVGRRDEVVRWILEARREHVARRFVWQRHWQASVSRRPARGRHHDSWSIRESYVRCHQSVESAALHERMRHAA